MSTVRPRGRSKGQQRSRWRGCKNGLERRLQMRGCETRMRDAACRGGGPTPISSCSCSSDFAPGTVDTLPQRHTSRMLPTRAVRELRLREVKTLDKVTGVCLIPGSFPPPRSIDLMLSQASLVLGTVPWWADEAGPTRGSALRWGLGKRPLQYHKPWRKRNHLSLGLERPPLPPPPIQAIGRRKGTSTLGLNSGSQKSLPGQGGC